MRSPIPLLAIVAFAITAVPHDLELARLPAVNTATR